MAGIAGEVLLGRYRLIDRIGRGGMGVVWRAHDDHLGRLVAAKEFHLPDELNEAARAERRKRLVREARAAARLRHPAVVSVHDVIEDDNRPWIIMELVEARSLEEIIHADGPVSAPQAARIGLRLLDALQAAHRAGVIHRDVKPANVLVGAGDRVVLSDFGIATYDGASTLTQTGALLGSPAYMAPEVARGEPARPASDLWSLGATLYAAVEGQSPYERDNAIATLGALLTHDPDPPRQAGPLRPAIDGLLRKDPGRRLSPRRTRALLSRVLTGGSARISVRLRRWARQRWKLIALGAVSVCVIGIAVTITLSGRTKPARPVAAPPFSTPQAKLSAGVSNRPGSLGLRATSECNAFVSTDDRVLYNNVLQAGEYRQFTAPKMYVVVWDTTCVDVYINGKPQPKAPHGTYKTYTVLAP